MFVPDLDTGCSFQEVEYEAKKSRFIARLYTVLDKAQAKQALGNTRADYPDARHHCWAYVLNSGTSAAMSDDGEPSGTAGKPILNALLHKQISDAMIVVSRYFGGIKLGAGGLARAYSKSAQMLVEASHFSVPVKGLHYKLEFDFALEQSIRHWLSQLNGEIMKIDYLESVCCEIIIPESAAEQFVNQLEAVSVKASVVD